MTDKGSIATQEHKAGASKRLDSALHGLVLLAQFHGIAADPVQIAHDSGRGSEPFDETTLLLAARKLGLKAKVVTPPVTCIAMAVLLALALSH